MALGCSTLWLVWLNELARITSIVPDEAWKIKTRSSVSFSAADLLKSHLLSKTLMLDINKTMNLE